jgi:hypothetical protein
MTFASERPSYVEDVLRGHIVGRAARHGSVVSASVDRAPTVRRNSRGVRYQIPLSPLPAGIGRLRLRVKATFVHQSIPPYSLMQRSSRRPLGRRPGGCESPAQV